MKTLFAPDSLQALSVQIHHIGVANPVLLLVAIVIFCGIAAKYMANQF